MFQKEKKQMLTEEKINQEIKNRRNKTNKNKKISYEIVDKFNAITEMGGKGLKEQIIMLEFLKNPIIKMIFILIQGIIINIVQVLFQIILIH